MIQKVLSSILIRNLQTVEELESVRNLEAIIWSMEDSVPLNQTIAAVKNGGFVLGAFLNGELIGFQYSFPGFDGKKIYLCSHSLGISPDYRKFGIGEKLKIAQKETALQKGYDLITWTFDPLETVNAHLNFHKLRGTSTTYMENAYGEMADNLNAGIPTDRLLVEWWINHSTKSENIFSVSDRYLTIKTSTQQNDLIPEQTDLTLENHRLFVPVPSNFQELKTDNFLLAVMWREKSRQVFTHYLNHGWVVTDLIRDNEIPNQYLYLLEKK
ncbi:GNAT family N-acetyltransferase [Metabacillus herbersteinensis]|uniref:GNAT family N-acetyltransferase n=1 Tax=Metabacillus herbersteinensis TaxID=283816 RepID=A0ABV6GG03_9BACI